jgi:DNA-binding response OmpR family regulator
MKWVKKMTEPSKPIALVVEDDENLANAFGYALEAFDVKIIFHGGEALDWLKNGNVPNVVVLDLNLPGAQGTDILDFIRAEERLKSVRVIVTTANDRVAETLHGQADLVLLKPVGYRQLQELADRLK